VDGVDGNHGPGAGRRVLQGLFLGFLKDLARALPRARRRHPDPPGDGQPRHPQTSRGERWLAANPRFHVHFTPTSGSWLNLVEVGFGIIDRQAIRCGAFPSVPDLVAKI